MNRFLPKQKGVLALLLALFLDMGTAYAADFSKTCSTGQTLYYNITNSTQHYVELTYPGENTWTAWEGFTKPIGTITLPSSVSYNGVNYAVKAIGDYAFFECSGLTGTLTIPNSVTTIGSWAFKGCSGFTGSLTIPNSVTTIDHHAFAECSGFDGSLTIPNSVTTIGSGAFGWCPNFTGSLTIPNSLTTIENFTFYDSGFTGGSLTIPNSVTSIGENAFCFCGFTGSLTLGNSLTSIGEHAFHDCHGFTGSLTIPNSVTTIGNSAFIWCHGFDGTLTIGTGVISMGIGVFNDCSGFTQVNYNAVNCADVEEHGKPFEGCGGTLTIGSNVQRIPAYMFEGCSGFTGSLALPSSLTSIGNYAFYNCSGFTGSLTLPSSLTSIGNYAFYNCFRFTGSLTIPNSVTMIGSSSFRDCSGFTGSLSIPNSVTSIGNYAFCNCSGFTDSLSIGNSVTVIGGAAFYNCGGFTGSLILPSSVTTIGDYAFQYCSGFTGSLTIPSSMTRIGNYAFRWCEGLTGSLTIGNSVTWIGNEAFAYCSNLTSMTLLPETLPTMGTDVFYNVPTTIPVYVHCSALEDYQAALQLIEFNIQCRETLTVYDGTSTSYYIPAYILYFDEFTKSQFVIPADDLADMTGTPISSMTFHTTNYNVPYTTVSSADVYLKEVNYTEISTFEPKTSATIVYSGYFDIVSTGNGGEMTINFNTPYTYNGGNLLVGIENTENNGWMDITFYGKTVNGASVSESSSSSLEYVQPVQQNFIPKTTFGYTPSDCSRPTGLTATDITSNSAMLNWTGFQDEYDVRYRKKPLFFESFENGLPSDWTTIDNDGDGYNWNLFTFSLSYVYSHSGTHVMTSASWLGGIGALTPDNWLITPQIELQGTMKVWLRTSAEDYPDEHFAIYLSTTDNSVSDFTTVLIPETTATNQYSAYTADLSAYMGQQGYIAIRHFNCTDMDHLLVDDFGIFNDPDASEWVFVSSTDNQLFIENLASNTEYEWQVWGRNCNGSGTYTDWSAAHSFTTKCEALVVNAGNPFTEDFEGADFTPDCWENIPSGNYHWSSTTGQSHSSSHSAFSSWYGDIYLVLPDLELSADAEAAQLSFWSYNSYPSDFAEGYNTVVLLDGGTETVLWSAETVSQEWVETIVDLTAYLGQTVSLAFKYAGYNGNGWYVDDVEVSASTNITQTSPLSAGTNWFSTYVDITLEDLQNALVEALPDATNITIKGKTQSSFYNGTRWRGALGSLDLALMYLIIVPESCEITLEGMPVDPAKHPITIKNGPNWIGFPFSESMTLDQAFPGFPVSGDKIQSKSDGQATYSNRWRGALNALVPGQGYIYKSNAAEDRVFTFPTGAK